MRVMFASPEIAPFAKTGGLADVTGALPKSIARAGIDVSVIMPLYRTVRKNFPGLEPTRKSIRVPLGDTTYRGALWTTKIPGTGISAYFIERDGFYDRDGLYNTQEGDYPDNAGRFIFFSRGVVEAIRELALDVDIVHCHDWQAALVPVYLRTIYSADTAVNRIRTVVTIHNIAFQGMFWHWDMSLAGLDWSLFNWKQLEFFGKMNCLKGGIVFADAVTTVSKGYAEEIQTEEFGSGLEGVLRAHRDKLSGIINGIDYADWDPRTDRLIPQNFDAQNPAGKQKCKEHLQQKLGLSKSNAPLIGLVGRLTEQKGHDIIEKIAEKVLSLGAQFAILGTGTVKYHEFYSDLSKRYPKKVSVNLKFDNQLAHEIEAGSDMFLMPSRFEPCGLNQMISLKYGTIPVVRRTGGLADTITDCTPEKLEEGSANGFSFTEYSGEALQECINRAVALYADRQKWTKLVSIAMSQDWSWERSAREYVALYRKIAGR